MDFKYDGEQSKEIMRQTARRKRSARLDKPECTRVFLIEAGLLILLRLSTRGSPYGPKLKSR